MAFDAAVNVGGSFTHSDTTQDFSVNSGSSLTISDTANSFITANNLEVRSGAVDVNFATAADGLTIVGTGATLNTIGNLDVTGGETDLQFDAAVNVGGSFTHSDTTQDFSVNSGSRLLVRGHVDIESNAFEVGGRIEFRGDVSTAFNAIFFGDATIAPGIGVGSINLDTENIATEDHAVEIRSGATYEWELGASENDVINVDGDLILRDFWTLDLLVLADALTGIDASDRFNLFTYTGQASAFTESSGQLTRVTIDDSLLDANRLDATGVGIFDDGNGTIFLTGLISVAVPEPSAVAILSLAFVCLSTRRKRAKHAANQR